jgi:hypothetical protein
MVAEDFGIYSPLWRPGGLASPWPVPPGWGSWTACDDTEPAGKGVPSPRVVAPGAPPSARSSNANRAGSIRARLACTAVFGTRLLSWVLGRLGYSAVFGYSALVTGICFSVGSGAVSGTVTLRIPLP